MLHPTLPLHDRRHYELRFRSLFDAGRALAFECDVAGHVDLDTLPARARLNYLYARTCVGREFASPEVRRRVAAPWRLSA